MAYDVECDRLFIGGHWTVPHGSDRLTVISPATGLAIASVAEASREDVEKAVLAARSSFDSGIWRDRSASDRAEVLHRAAALLRERLDQFTEVSAAESGIPVSLGRGLTAKSAVVLDYYADMVANGSDEELRQGNAHPIIVRREAIGVVALVTPWNAPMPITHFGLAPALAAGCSVVLKPPPEAPLHALMLAQVYKDAGLPEGVLSVLPAGREVSEALVSHPGVDKITFTGSTATGRRIAQICGESFRRFSLELGGKSAAIVLDDVDLARRLPLLVGTALQNSGQACVGQTRILVPKRREDEIVEALAAQFRAKVVGDPMDMATEMGPLISERQRSRVESYIAAGLAQGARIVTGGSRPTGLERGWYVEPTLFAGVSNDMTIAQEEIFGPVVSVIPYADEAQAIAVANDSPYGLSGTVWTEDQERGKHIARRVRSGNYGVNAFALDEHTPFGGFKSSGMGRQLGPEGLAAFYELKSIVFEAGSA